MKKNGYVYSTRDICSLRQLAEGSADEFSSRPAFLLKNSEGVVYEKSYTRFAEEIKAYATALCNRGFENKKIAVMGKNSYEWILTYFAVCCGVGVIVPIDRELKSADISNILADCGASLVIYSPEMSETVSALETKTETISTAEIQSLIAEGEQLLDAGDKSYENHIINPFELGILLYTSGTTGIAKGVMLSQYNICSDMMMVCRRVKVFPDDVALSILPLHHTYECMAGHLTILYCGGAIAYAESIRKIIPDMKLYRPTLLAAVPLLLENIHANIIKNAKSGKYGELKLGIAKGAAGFLGKLNIDLRKKIFAQVHSAFGGRLRVIFCGAAALSPDVNRDLTAFGFKIYSGYGLTETSPVCIMHDDYQNSPGDTGKPLDGMKAVIDNPNDEGVGELFVKGPNVMLGYYKKPEETAKVMRGGWFNTGDLARKNPDGTYTIMGRTKTMIVTKNGKKIFPEELEFHLEKSKFISESMVYGNEDEGDTVVYAIIKPNIENIDEFLLTKGITPAKPEYDGEIQKLLSLEVKRVNSNQPHWKQIRRFKIKNGEFIKTTTKKIKRNAPENRMA